LEVLIHEHAEAHYGGEPAHFDTPERLFQKAWAETLFARVLQRLAQECAARPEIRFDIMEPFLALGREPDALTTAAAELGLTLPAFKSRLHRLRQRYRELLLDEVGQTVRDRTQVDEELQGLLEALQT
jgi:hypothetical protein